MKITFTKINFISCLLFMLFFTSSWDIVGAININGFNFRINQLFSVLVIFIWLSKSIIERKITLPYASQYILGFVFLQLIFIKHSPDIKNAVGYFLWLLLDYFMVCSINYIVIKYAKTKQIIRLYIYSFACMSLLGLVQFFLYPLGVDFFVAQSWTSSIARINGFSYEPSYFSTYMIIGASISLSLLAKKDYEILTKKNYIFYHLLFFYRFYFVRHEWDT